MRKQAARRRASMGLIIVLVVLVVLALFGMKVVPSYIEFRTAKKAIDAIAREQPARHAARHPPRVRRRAGDRRHQRRSRRSDLEISKEGNAGRDRLRLPQGSAAVRQRGPVHRLRGELGGPVDALTRLAALEKRLGYRFAAPRLLEQALTHRSHGAEHNERLEFLGDGVLGCAVADELYARFPQLSEGKLTRLRASLVREEALAEVAQRARPRRRTLRLGEGELAAAPEPRPSILADALEAVFGAVFLDGGYDAARKRGARAPSARASSASTRSAPAKDAEDRLQEILQARAPAAAAVPRRLACRARRTSSRSRSSAASRSSSCARAGPAASRQRAEQEAAQRACSRSSADMSAPLRHHRHRRAAEHRQVEPAQPPGRAEALDRLAQAADHAAPRHRHPDAARLPVRLRRRAGPAAAAEERAAPARSTAARPRPRATRMWRCSWSRRGASAPRTSARWKRIPEEQKVIAVVNKIDTVKTARRPDPVPRAPVARRANSTPSSRSARRPARNIPELLQGRCARRCRRRRRPIPPTSSPTATSASSPPSCCARSCSRRSARSCPTAARS